MACPGPVLYWSSVFSPPLSPPPHSPIGNRDDGSGSWRVRGRRGSDRCHPAASRAVWTGQWGDSPAPTSRASHRHGNCHQPGHLAGEQAPFIHTRTQSKCVGQSEQNPVVFRILLIGNARLRRDLYNPAPDDKAMRKIWKKVPCRFVCEGYLHLT